MSTINSLNVRFGAIGIKRKVFWMSPHFVAQDFACEASEFDFDSRLFILNADLPITTRAVGATFTVRFSQRCWFPVECGNNCLRDHSLHFVSHPLLNPLPLDQGRS
jgi:hypothetical protein